MPHKQRDFARPHRDLIFDVAMIATQRALVVAEDLPAGLECALSRELDRLFLSRLRRGRRDLGDASKDNRCHQLEIRPSAFAAPKFRFNLAALRAVYIHDDPP
jgi:hypothetical protein